MKKDYIEIVAMKQNAEIIFNEFKHKYGKSTHGIAKIKSDILLSNDLKEIEKLMIKMIGYITKSKRAKELRE